MIDSCFEIVQDIKAREAQDEVSPPLRPIYERLSQLVQQLEQLSESPWADVRRVVERKTGRRHARSLLGLGARHTRPV